MNEDDKWSAASLRLFSRALSPEVMGEAPGILPDRVHRVGDPVSRHHVSATTRQEHAFFIKSSLPADRPLEDHIRAVLERIEPAVEYLRGLGEQVEADLFCGFSSGNGQGGFALSPELLGQLAELGLELVVDLYPPSAVPSEF